MKGLDQIDRRILAELMDDATTPVARIADRVGLSQTPCWKRIRRLEEEGIVSRRVAVVDPPRVGLGLTAFVGIEAADHGAEWKAAFASAVDAMPEVMEVFRMAGAFDYLLRVVVADMAAFDAFYHRLTEALPIRTLTSHFAMERMKAATVLPLP